MFLLTVEDGSRGHRQGSEHGAERVSCCKTNRLYVLSRLNVGQGRKLQVVFSRLFDLRV